MQPIQIETLGWTPALADDLAKLGRPDLVPARVSGDLGISFDVMAATGEQRARLRSIGAAPLRPAVGDWVALLPASPSDGPFIEAVLPRRTVLERKVAGLETAAQVMAANVDVIGIVAALARDINPRRIERYLAVAWESGAEPVLILTKADLEPDIDSVRNQLAEVSAGLETIVTSAVTGTGIEQIRDRLAVGLTAVLIGPSGAGKSSLLNTLLGAQVMRTAEVQAGGDGRHATTHRQLLALPHGGTVIDTPGIRELQLWSADEGLDRTFPDIEELARACRFTDCRHDREPGCAVAAAIAAGTLAEHRLASWTKLLREMEAIERRSNARAQAEARRGFRVMARSRRGQPSRDRTP